MPRPTTLRRRHAFAALSLIAAVFVSTPRPASADGTIVEEGEISDTWTLARSPYCVNGHLRVRDLVIEPGVVVRVAAARQIEIVGRLVAEGTAARPILFTSWNPGEEWRGLLFNVAREGSSLVHCRIEKSDHGALRLFDSAPVIRNCTFAGNRDVSFTDGAGAGVDADIFRGDLVLEGCTIEGNVSKLQGGGVRVRVVSGALRLRDCRILSNLSNPSLLPIGGGPETMYFDSEGGGVYCDGDLEMTGCVVAGNTCVSRKQGGLSLARGAGIYAYSGHAVLENCLVEGNHVKAESHGRTSLSFAFGAGIFAESSTLEMRNCIVANNVASTVADEGATTEARAAGVLVNGGSATLANVTITGNTHHGLFANGTTAKISDSIVIGDGLPVEGVEARFSDVDGPGDALLAGEGNIEADPLFLGGDGPLDRFRLRRSSPCVDAGDPLAALGDASLPPGRGGVRRDMGAFGGPGAAGWFSRAFAGNVGAGAGPVVPVLSVAGSTRAATLRRGEAFELALDAAEAGPSPARYVLWIGRGFAFGSAPLVAKGELVGVTALPTPFEADRLPRPVAFLRSRGPGLDVSDLVGLGGLREIRVAGTESAPFRVALPAALPPEALFTIQGLVRDDAATHPSGFAVTNAVVVQVGE